MIRQFQKDDVLQVMDIWLRANTQAHPFIPKAYWESNFMMVQEQLLLAELFVCEADGRIQGFIGLQDEYIAGIFVDKEYRSCGIGRQLLEHVKQIHDKLSLGVYIKNSRAVDFYRREGFSIVSEAVDEATGEKEYEMCWKAAI